MTDDTEQASPEVVQAVVETVAAFATVPGDKVTYDDPTILTSSGDKRAVVVAVRDDGYFDIVKPGGGGDTLRKVSRVSPSRLTEGWDDD